MAGALPVGRRARTTRTTPSDYMWTTLLFGAHSSSRLLVASVPRQLVTWTTPQRNCPSPTHQTCSLRAQPACCTAHLRELPAQAPRSPVDLHFAFALRGWGMCTTRHGQASWNQPFEGPATAASLAERAHRAAYTFADGARPTFAGIPWTTGTAV